VAIFISLFSPLIWLPPSLTTSVFWHPNNTSGMSKRKDSRCFIYFSSFLFFLKFPYFIDLLIIKVFPCHCYDDARNPWRIPGFQVVQTKNVHGKSLRKALIPHRQKKRRDEIDSFFEKSSFLYVENRSPESLENPGFRVALRLPGMTEERFFGLFMKPSLFNQY
jgi:hypothetical protein